MNCCVHLCVGSEVKVVLHVEQVGVNVSGWQMRLQVRVVSSELDGDNLVALTALKSLSNTHAVGFIHFLFLGSKRSRCDGVKILSARVGGGGT